MIDSNHPRNLAVRRRAGSFLLPVLIAGLGLMLVGQVTAQTFTTLHSFRKFGGTNSDGTSLYAGLITNSSGNTLFGTAAGGGSGGQGTVFAVNTDGTGFKVLYNFTATSGSSGNFSGTNSDGAYPEAALILSGNTLYGTATEGGSSGNGTVFKVNTDGTGFATLHSFTALPVPYYSSNSDGAIPLGGLILSGNTLYGTATYGGSSANGTVFKVNTDGTGFATLHSFTVYSVHSDSYATNSDGVNPVGGLILLGNTLYGTASEGGSGNRGTVFAVNTDGTGFTTLHNFAGWPSDGDLPSGGLALSGNTLYGTAAHGGSGGQGTVFAVNTDGTGFATLHSFTAAANNRYGYYTNSDGAEPYAGLILLGNTLYGTAPWGSSGGQGTVFAVNTDGTGFTNLHSFSLSDSEGVAPLGGLILSGNTLYGTTHEGGSGIGTIFSLSFQPQPTIIPSAANVVLSWPTNYAGFDYSGYTLQSTTNLGLSALWTTNSPAPVVVNGQNTVTNPISGTQQFFRLSQ